MKVRFYRLDDKWCKEAIDLVKDIDYPVLTTSLNHKYTQEDCKPYKLIASCTTGTDHIQNGDVPLICLKGETDFLQNVYATAEHTIALMLALVRKIPQAHNDVLNGNWKRENWQGSELHGKTLGIVGYGRVGYQVTKIAVTFGMWITVYDKYNDKCFIDYGDNGFYENARLEFVLKDSDIITVHVPLNEETKGMFGREQFELMKPTAYFINTSRGAVVNEDALLWALENRQIAGAALDVVCNEPNINPKLIEYAKTHDNLILSPHLGGNTVESRKKTQIFIANKIKEYIKGVGLT